MLTRFALKIHFISFCMFFETPRTDQTNRQQEGALEKRMKQLKKVGLYCSCNSSINPLDNEQMIGWFKTKEPSRQWQQEPHHDSSDGDSKSNNKPYISTCPQTQSQEKTRLATS